MADPKHPNAGRKILIIDDEELLLRMSARWFEQEGFSVFTVDNGTDGLALAERELPDVTLLDVNMPGLHGFEVCRRMRENPALARSIIIMTSARSYKPDIEKAKALGANDYLVKPAGADELLGIVKKYLKPPTSVR
ncbi:MAG TPA: response regulator [Bacteroidota bacterium]|nr:response regulator [Bacteroidota bacterium]